MLAIIPARGGSKGLPCKNIKLLNEKPLIAYTIETAKEAKLIDRIIVSTDDVKIAETAKKYGAEVPFLRPMELATDNAKAIDNYIFTIEELKKRENKTYNNFIILQPTSPLRTANDIDTAINLFNYKKADSVISFSEAIHPPLWAKKIDKTLKITNYFKNYAESKNRQEIETAYMPNGAVFVFKYSLLKTKLSYYSDKTYAYIMPQRRSIDIDNIIDFEFAEFLMKKNNERSW